MTCDENIIMAIIPRFNSFRINLAISQGQGMTPTSSHRLIKFKRLNQ